jgi:16S rRNA (guanine527-N7)-methyltransferase
MISPGTIAALLEPFGLSLSSQQVEQITLYLDLLLRWNRKINLTAIRGADECVARHFGESLYLARFCQLSGSLLDIGSGAGFPGLALKIPFPDMAATLLEPVAKKRAFLKEVARVCVMSSVSVRGERWEDFTTRNPEALFDAVTARAVGELERLVPAAARCLRPGGSLCLWLGLDQIPTARQASKTIVWSEPILIPLARQRVILMGIRH